MKIVTKTHFILLALVWALLSSFTIDISNINKVEKSKVEKNKSKMAIRTSMSDFREEIWLTNLPLYAINELTGYLESKINQK